MKQEDKLNFVQAMEKEIEDHESRDHWSILERSSMPKTAKPICAIWSFQHKQRPNGTLLKHTVRLCALGGTQTWEQITGKILPSSKHDNSMLNLIDSLNKQP